MSPAEALAFVERHGIVLESARHATVPCLAEAIAGEAIRGSWWSHPQGSVIFRLTRSVRESEDVLVCGLVDGKISFAHARVWPALVRLADRFAPSRLARISETHTPGGAHRVEKTPFPRWVPAATMATAKGLGDSDARASLAAIFPDLTQ